MTNEEAKRRLEVWLKCMDCPEDKQCYDSHLHSTCEYTDYCDETPVSEAVKVAIKALEQEPKTGHWIGTAEEYYKAVNEYGGGVNENTPYFVDDIACSECLAKYSVIDNETERFDHCPSCGAKMVEPQERSGEE